MSFKNILVYIEPWIEDSKPGWKKNYIWWFGNIINSLIAAQKNELHTTFIIGDDCAMEWDKHKNCPARELVITQQELKTIFPNARTALVSWIKEDYTPLTLNKMASLVQSKLVDFIPDVIFTITPAPFLEALYPEALMMYRDAMYCREPWPDQMTCFDPFGININSILRKNATDLLNIPNTKESDEFVEQVKNQVLSSITQNNPLSEVVENFRSNFEHLLLLPLQSSGHYNFYSSTQFLDQFEYLTYVLDHVPHDIGVIVTQHPDDLTLNENAVHYLRTTYPHFLFEEKTNQYHSPSQFLLEYVDGLVCISSGLCYQALLWNKPIFIVGNSIFSLFSEPYSLTKIKQSLNKPCSQKTGLLMWFLSHYFFSYDYLNDSAWLHNYIIQLLEYKRSSKKGIEIFPLIDEPQLIINKLALKKRNIVVEKPNLSKNDSNKNTESLYCALEQEKKAVAHLKNVLSEKEYLIQTFCSLKGQLKLLKRNIFSYCEKLRNRESQINEIKVALFNDTGPFPHVGCKGVSDANDRLLENSNARVLFRHILGEYQDLIITTDLHEAIQQVCNDSLIHEISSVDAILVNGEGTIHHGHGLHLLAILARAQLMGKRTYLVNAVMQEIPESFFSVLRKLNDLTVRDFFSFKYLQSHNIQCRLVPDSILMANFNPGKDSSFKGKIIVTDCVASRKDIQQQLQFVLKYYGDEAIYFPLVRRRKCR